MFYFDQKEEQREKYQQYLSVIGSFSKLFSDSKVPYLYYRVAEKIFCRAFDAEDLSRSDVSVDAKKGNIGIGLKTFLVGNSKTFQKVAEFNATRSLYTNLPSKELIKKVAQLRNDRIEFTENAYKLEKSIYHCVLRDRGKFKLFEELMDKIDINNIRDIQVKKTSIVFTDGRHDYSFLLSKSTLTKRFKAEKVLYEFDVDILEDPLVKLQKSFGKKHLIVENF